MEGSEDEIRTTKKQRPFFIIGAVVFVGLLIATPFLPALKGREQVSQWDGMIQTEWKILGVIPYSSLEPDRTVKVTEAFWKELAKAGIEPDSGFRQSKLSLCTRHYRLPGLDYFARSEYEANVADLDRFYSSQLKKQPNSTGYELIFNSASGPQRQVIVTVTGPGSKPGLSKVDVMITFVLEPHVP